MKIKFILLLIFTITLVSSSTIEFVPPTPNNGTSSSNNYIYLNLTTTSASNHSAWIDFNKSLLGWWSFDYYNTTHFFDNSSYENNGIIFDGVNQIGYENFNMTGHLGKSVMTQNNDKTTLSSPNYNFSNGSFSVSVWAKANSSNYPVIWSTIIGSKSQIYSGGISSWGIYFYSTSGKISALVRDASTTKNIVDSLTYSQRGIDDFHHMVMVVDRENDNFTFYVDGGLIGSQNISMIGDVTVTNDIIIAPDFEWDGFIDEIMLFNRSISEQEIKALYNAGENKLYNNFTNLNNGTYNYEGYMFDTSGNFNSTGEMSYTVSSEIVEDSCTYTSGDWFIECSDNCLIDSNVDIGGNSLILNGTGSFNIEANITNISNIDFVDSLYICNMAIGQGSMVW